MTDMLRLCEHIRKHTKPMMIALNKADIATPELIREMTKVRGYMSRAHLRRVRAGLRKAAKAKLIKYLPGESSSR